MSEIHETQISFSEIRRRVGLSPLAGGLAAGLTEVAPVNAENVNDAAVAKQLASSEFPKEIATGLPRGTSAADLLQKFSWRVSKTKALLTPVMDQGMCGCCWAVASVACINDRLAIKTKKNPFFHFQEVLACDGTCRPCSTCSVRTGFAYASSSGLTPTNGVDAEAFASVMRKDAGQLSNIGMPSGVSKTPRGTGSTGGGLLMSSSTEPVSVGKQVPTDVCARMRAVLSAQSKQPKKLAGVGQPQRSASILALQRCIMQHGPVVTIMRVYTDFIVGSSPGSPAFASTEGIYVHREGKTNYEVTAERNATLGTHCMVIVGWGVSAKGVRYWEVRNSWGTGWGDAGYCKIAMTDGALGNSSVGIDLAVASIKNNITTYRYGNMWVLVDDVHEITAKTYGLPLLSVLGGASLCSPAQKEAKLHRARIARALSLLGTGLLLLFLCYSLRT